MSEQLAYSPAVRAAASTIPASIPPSGGLSPDEELKRGIIHTNVSRTLARAITVVFLLAIFAVPLSQFIIEIARGERLQEFDVFLHSPSKSNFNRYEEDLARSSFLRQSVQPWVQAFESDCFGHGNGKAIIGRNGWLYYEPGISYLGGPGILDENRLHPPRGKLTEDDTRGERNPDPRPAILQFNEQCNAAGCHLIIVPVPDKAMLQASQLSTRFPPGKLSPSLNNQDYERLIAELRTAGVDVFDPLHTAASIAGSQFLTCDTHWTPAYMEHVAARLADYINDQIHNLKIDTSQFRQESTTVSNDGDLVQMLKLPPGQQVFPAQRVTIHRIIGTNGQPVQPLRDANVLVLGDSFTNIYSLDTMGWGESAGFSEQLSFALRRPVDRISRNDAGAFATREILSRERAKGSNRLAGKKVVVWEFAVRELTAGNWKLLDMKLGTPKPKKFIVPLAQSKLTVTATVAAAAKSPRPGSVPYKDHIIAVHLVDLKGAENDLENGEALVYMWSMRANVLQTASRYREGDSVKLRLSRWQELEKTLGAINRAELPDDELLLEEPCWGEEARP